MNLRRLLPILLLCLPWPLAAAADTANLYVAQAPVADRSSAARTEALADALGEVLVRVTGDPQIARRQAAGPVLEQAPDLVQRYGYERASEVADDDPQTADPGTTPGLLLRAVFDPGAVDRALRQAGLPVWGRERPRTLVWLVVDGEADIVSQQAADRVAEAMRRAAEARGIPLVFPTRDGSERRRIRAADIRAGNLEQAREAARHYDASHVLIGRVERIGGGWRGDWSLARRSEPMGQWTAAAGQADQALSEAVNRMANIYARRFAVYGGERAGTMVAVAVDGVAGLQDYARISRYLREITAVESVTPVLVDREAVVFRVQLNGGARVLARSIELANWLRDDELARNLAGLHAAGGEALGYRFDS